jgi:hypothetical protein
MTNYYSNQGLRALCSLSLGSMTQALKAKRLLGRFDIRVNVKKLSVSNNTSGCIYGIEYPCEISGNVNAILKNGGISSER